MASKPATQQEFIAHQETTIERLREKIKNEFATLDYIAMNGLSLQIKRRKNLIGLAKIGKFKDYYI